MNRKSNEDDFGRGKRKREVEEDAEPAEERNDPSSARLVRDDEDCSEEDRRNTEKELLTEERRRELADGITNLKESNKRIKVENEQLLREAGALRKFIQLAQTADPPSASPGSDDRKQPGDYSFGKKKQPGVEDEKLPPQEEPAQEADECEGLSSATTGDTRSPKTMQAASSKMIRERKEKETPPRSL